MFEMSGKWKSFDITAVLWGLCSQLIIVRCMWQRRRLLSTLLTCPNGESRGRLRQGSRNSQRLTECAPHTPDHKYGICINRTPCMARTLFFINMWILRLHMGHPERIRCHDIAKWPQARATRPRYRIHGRTHGQNSETNAATRSKLIHF